MLSHSTFDFLRQLAENNHQAWFQAHKTEYEAARKDFLAFCETLLNELAALDPIYNFTKAKDCVYRIYRDVRFSQDKTPYKSWLAAYFAPMGKNSDKMGYYLHVQPDGKSFLGGGLFECMPEQLAKFRQEIHYEPDKFYQVLDNADFKAYFGNPQGTRLKTAPKGYAKDHPHIELLRYTQLYVSHIFSDSNILAEDFPAQFMEGCRLMRPLLDLIDEAIAS